MRELLMKVFLIVTILLLAEAHHLSHLKQRTEQHDATHELNPLNHDATKKINVNVTVYSKNKGCWHGKCWAYCWFGKMWCYTSNDFFTKSEIACTG